MITKNSSGAVLENQKFKENPFSLFILLYNILIIKMMIDEKKKNDYNFFLIKLTLIHRFQINQQKKAFRKELIIIIIIANSVCHAKKIILRFLKYIYIHINKLKFLKEKKKKFRTFLAQTKSC